MIELEVRLTDGDLGQIFLNALNNFLGRQGRIRLVGKQDGRLCPALVVVAVNRANIELLLARKQIVFDGVNCRLDAFQRMLAFDVVRHKQTPPDILREHVELDDAEHHR